MTDIKPASEVRDEIQKSIEDSLESDKSAINSAIDAAKNSSSDAWPVAYDIASKDKDYQDKLDSEVRSGGYSTELKDGKLYINRP